MNESFTSDEEKMAREFITKIDDRSKQLIGYMNHYLKPLLEDYERIPTLPMGMDATIGNLLSHLHPEGTHKIILNAAEEYKVYVTSKIKRVINIFIENVLNRLKQMYISEDEVSQALSQDVDEPDQGKIYFQAYKRLVTYMNSVQPAMVFVYSVRESFEEIIIKYEQVSRMRNNPDLEEDKLEYPISTQRFFNMLVPTSLGVMKLHEVFRNYIVMLNGIMGNLMEKVYKARIASNVYIERGQILLGDFYVSDDDSIGSSSMRGGNPDQTSMESISEIAGPFIVPGGDGFNEMEDIEVDPNDVHDLSNISEGLEASLNNSLNDWSGDMLNVANGDIFFQGEEGEGEQDFSTLDDGETTTESITVSFGDLDSIGTDTLAWMSPDNSMDGR
jgi:hypothetical protein